MYKKIFSLFISILLLINGYAQKSTTTFAGFGLGLDYGGIGLKAEFLPVKSIGIFAGAGANFDKIGYNAGLSWKVLPNKKSTPHVMAMYGYNAVLKVKSPSSNNAIFSKTYYGPSIGTGYDINVGKKKNKISLAVIVPFRDDAYEAKYNEYKALGFTFKQGIQPVLVSIGYNIGGN